MSSLFHPTIGMDRQDFVTSLSVTPSSSTQGIALSSTPRGYQQRISTTSLRGSGSDDLRRLTRRDVVVRVHTHLTACTQVLKPVPSPSDAVARSGIHA
jgi:hypothetical protein